MHWTKAKPTKDGAYWYRRYKFKANSVCEVRNGIVRWAFALHDERLSEMTIGEWWGPLVGPDDGPEGALDAGEVP